MATSVSSVLSRIARHFPDIEPTATTTLRMELLNTVHRDLIHVLPIDVRAEDISVTSGTEAYAINVEDASVWHVDWVTSATEARRLIATDWSTLNRKMGDWRNQDGEPTHYAIWRDSQAQKLFIWQVPDQTTSGGYPVARMYVSRYTALSSSGDMPESVRSSDAWVYGVCHMYCVEERQWDDAQRYRNLQEEAITKELEAIRGKSIEAPAFARPHILPFGVTRRGR